MITSRPFGFISGETSYSHGKFLFPSRSPPKLSLHSRFGLKWKGLARELGKIPPKGLRKANTTTPTP